jgi:hypothetical protein
MNNHINKSESVQLLGQWVKNANEYINNNSNVRLLIVNRKHCTENKPPRYALIKHPTEQREYLSGIYPTDDINKFRIDYKGKNYIVTFTENTIFSIAKK